MNPKTLKTKPKYGEKLIGFFLIIFLSYHTLIAQDAQDAQAESPDCSGEVMLDVNFNNHQGGTPIYTEAMMKADFAGNDIVGHRGFGNDFPQKNKVGNGMLIANYPGGAKMGAWRSGFIFERRFTDAEEATMEYRVKFDENFEWAAGGKLPGLGGKDHSKGSGIPMGCTDKENNIKNGFTARLMWRKNGKLVAYTYFPDRKKRCGEDITIATVTSGTWITIKQYIKLNTAGQKDGLLKVYIDGALVLDENNIKYRINPNVKINYAVMHTYRGGDQNNSDFYASKEFNAYFDDFKVIANCPADGTTLTEEEQIQYQEEFDELAEEQATQEEIDDGSNAEVEDEFTPDPMPQVDEIDLNDFDQLDVGVLDLFDDSFVVAGSAGEQFIEETLNVDPKEFKYEENKTALSQLPKPVPLKLPTNYLKQIDDALGAADKVVGAADKNTGLSYWDLAGWLIRKYEKKYTDNYVKASRNTTVQLGIIGATTEVQFAAREKLGLTTIIKPDFINIRKECGNYFMNGKRVKCKQKVDYLENSMEIVEDVITAYSKDDKEMNNGIGEQIREKYISIYNKIYGELEEVRLETTKALNIRRLLKK